MVRVKGGTSLIDMSSVPTFDVLVPAGIDGESSHGIILVTEPAPPDLAADTGVQYWATSFSFTHFECPGERASSLSSACLAKLHRKFGNEP